MIDTIVCWALRSKFGFLLAGETCGILGFGIVMLQYWLAGIFGRLGDDILTFAIATVGYLVIATILGAYIGFAEQRKSLGWLAEDRQPTPAEARRVQLMPLRMLVLNGSLWLPGLLVEIVLFVALGHGKDLAPGALLVLSGALGTSGFNYLVFDRLVRPLIPQVTAVVPPAGHPSSSAAARLGITWLLASGVPLTSVIVLLTDHGSRPEDRIIGAVVLASIALLGGVVATGALAKSVALPLQQVRSSLHRIEQGDLNFTTQVTTTSEIGLVQASVNDMTDGLRERVRMRDVFGRHVGHKVAERALSTDVDLSGELREVTALFVDVAGSTELAHRLEPRDFVDKLNRLLTIVVDATAENDGLVNKFEGDAALCIFGAPFELDDDATAALRAARRIRDEVLAIDELDIGIGVARGLVFAGNVGSQDRLEYTVIGDPVNEAARLTDASKRVRQRILVSQAVIESASSSERDLWSPHGVLRLRGRAEETKSWSDNRGRGHRSSASNSEAVETGLSQTNL